MARRSRLVAAIVRAHREAQRREAARLRAEQQAARQFQRAQEHAQRLERQARASAARTQKEHEREQARIYGEARLNELAFLNQKLEERVAALNSLLSDVLDVDTFLDLDTLRPELMLPTFDPGGLDQPEPEPNLQDYLPQAPSPLARLWPGHTAAYERQVAAARQRYETDRLAHAARERARLTALADARDQYHRQVFAAEEEHEAQNAAIDELKQRVAEREPRAVAEYFQYVLEASSYPEGFPTSIKVAYVPTSMQLVIEKDLPDLQVVPDLESYRYIKARDELSVVPRPAGQRKALYASVLAQTTLRTLHEVFQADRAGHIGSIVLNGYVEAIDPGLGTPLRSCLVTVRTTRDTFLRLNLRQVEPIACLKALNAGVSRSPAELTPVRPVLEFDMVDPRFIEESDILSSLDQRPNLMDLTPGEFESLITNLFEKMGLETRLTQASRDGGVDCVAYDPRPIFGGKVIIQAKRYRHTVGVSAVRDLFGTLQNEGASKGILVTTSGYGKAAFDFANGKPLELLSGEHLLFLLKEHAGLEARIEMPSTWRDAPPNTGEG